MSSSWYLLDAIKPHTKCNSWRGSFCTGTSLTIVANLALNSTKIICATRALNFIKMIHLGILALWEFEEM